MLVKYKSNLNFLSAIFMIKRDNFRIFVKDMVYIPVGMAIAILTLKVTVWVSGVEVSSNFDFFFLASKTISPLALLFTQGLLTVLCG